MVEPDGSFGAWVRELRRRLGLTQGELGKRVGVGQGAVSKWELGRVVPPAATRARLAELAEGVGLGPPPERGGDEG
jgi:transcriptional regulator with XRE-family HTH domain